MSPLSNCDLSRNDIPLWASDIQILTWKLKQILTCNFQCRPEQTLHLSWGHLSPSYPNTDAEIQEESYLFHDLLPFNFVLKAPTKCIYSQTVGAKNTLKNCLVMKIYVFFKFLTILIYYFSQPTFDIFQLYSGWEWWGDPSYFIWHQLPTMRTFQLLLNGTHQSTQFYQDFSTI